MFHINRKRCTAVLAAVSMAWLASSSIAQQPESPDPYARPDQSWISISGTAVHPVLDGFTLDYGEGTVFVEMDDWDWYNDSSSVLDGDKVTVYGEIDDDFFEATTIEAGSVYVENLGTYFYANSDDEESAYTSTAWISTAPIVVGETTARGIVTDVTGREFTIDTGLRQITVDTIGMAYNPMDDQGYQQIDEGDYVSVTGEMDYDFWENRELAADIIINLDENGGS